jgi:hypothetical protein
MPELSELDLLDFFETEPERDEYLLAYTVGEPTGIQLRFRFNPIEQYVQTELLHNGDKVVTASHEGSARMWIEGSDLRAEFPHRDTVVRLDVSVRPRVRVEWVGLKTA